MSVINLYSVNDHVKILDAMELVAQEEVAMNTSGTAEMTYSVSLEGLFWAEYAIQYILYT